MMNLTTLPKSFWGYALETAARILNMVLTKKVDRTPYEIWHGKSPKLSYLRVWGCEALVKRDTPDKLDSKSIKCIFVAYPKEMMGYYFYYPQENKIFVSQNADFFENSFMVQEASGSHGLPEMSGSDKGLELIQEEDTQPFENTSKEHTEIAPTEEYELGDLNEPLNYKAALADPESDKWLESMNTEMQSMKYNQVWYLVDLPSNGRTIGCKWLFKKKTDTDSNVHTFKARLVAKGFTQTYGVDYGKTFSPVADIRAMSIAMLQEVKSWLCKCFSMNDLGEAAYILGIKIIRDRSKRLITLSQSAYLEKTLKKFRMENSKKGYTPMMEKPDYRKSQGAKTPTEVQRMQRFPYASAIGSIMYAVRCTRPDVAFAQNLFSRFQQNPDMVLVYGAKPEDELKVSCYADASFQTDKDDTKSQTGYVFVLNGGAVDWKSAKQSTTVMSSTAEASMEAVWIRKFIDGLGGVIPSNKRPMEMLCDNEPALAIIGDLRILKGAKHFQRKYHYIREVIQ
ncbi:retrotransposon protein, putative, ty1-copia subclass [Tanacetum coccineum]